MGNQSDEIFLLQGETLQPLPTQTMRAGLFGKTLEDALQTILQKYPAVIPGKQIDPVSDDPPRFVLLRREMPVGGWSLDHLYVDQNGILTLVETKLIQNPESRREVIGQIIEYAANALEFWGTGRARQFATEFWAKQGSADLDEILRKEFGEELDIEEFWTRIETNLKTGRVRLIVAADELRPEVRRMLEYLNTETQNAEVLGLELKCYGNDSKSLVLVPQLVGQTQRNISQTISRSNLYLWTPDKLMAAFREFEDHQLGNILQLILEWSMTQGIIMNAHRNKYPSIAIQRSSGVRFASFYNTARVYLYIANQYWDKSLDQRSELIKELKSFNLLDQNLNPEEIPEGRNLNSKITELNEDQLSKLLDIFTKYCHAS